MFGECSSTILEHSVTHVVVVSVLKHEGYFFVRIGPTDDPKKVPLAS